MNKLINKYQKNKVHFKKSKVEENKYISLEIEKLQEKQDGWKEEFEQVVTRDETGERKKSQP